MSQAHLHQPSLLDSPHLIWFAAIVLSISAHALLLLQKKPYHMAEPAMVIQETITHVRFATITPPPIKAIAPEVKITIPTPPQKQQADPIKKSLPKQEAKPEKKAKPKPELKKKPKVKSVKRIKKKNTTKPVVKQKTNQLKAAAPSATEKTQVKKQLKASPIISEADKRLIEQTRKNYYALLMRHIEAHKHYPQVARRRKIEGKILVSFTLFGDGSIKALTINGKKSILKKATGNALNDALPMPAPPKEMNIPMTVKFNMNYFLK